MSQKPLGQIAHEAKLAIDLNAWMTPAWDDLPPPRREAEEVAAQAVRTATLEEVAKHLCPHCAKGKKIAFETYLGKYDHGNGPCHAAEIWMLLKGRPE